MANSLVDRLSIIFHFGIMRKGFLKMPHPHSHAHAETLQELLKDLRHEKNLTQVDLAVVLEQSQSFVSKYESGERILDILEVRFLCLRLGITLTDFCARLERRISQAEGTAS